MIGFDAGDQRVLVFRGHIFGAGCQRDGQRFVPIGFAQLHLAFGQMDT